MNTNHLSRRQWLQAVTAIGIAAAGSILFVSQATAGEGPAPSVIDVASRRELFVDDHLIEKLSGEAALRLHHPTPREVSIVFDAPWEGSGSGYHTIFQDGDLYRMYYRGLHLEVSKGKLSSSRHEPFYCYAESTDGVRWTRPELGIVEFDGSKKNNIILKGRGTHNFAAFKDDQPRLPAPGPLQGPGRVSKAKGGLFAFQSADALHWSLLTEKPVITNGAFDSQNLAFWDTTLGKYRAYWRTFTAGVTTEKKWAPSGLSGRSHRNVRRLPPMDRRRRPHLRRLARRTPLHQPGQPILSAPRTSSSASPAATSNAAGPTRCGRSPIRKTASCAPRPSLRYGTALTEGLLMASRDGVHFKRWNEAFLRPGVQRPGTWQYGQQYIACHVVQTAPSLPGTPDELSLYATEGYWHNKGGILRRFTLRTGRIRFHPRLDGRRRAPLPAPNVHRLPALAQLRHVGRRQRPRRNPRPRRQTPSGLRPRRLPGPLRRHGRAHRHLENRPRRRLPGRQTRPPARRTKDADLYSFQFQGD